MTTAGLHHVTAITADIVHNVHFYTKVLGLRLVKKTVNQDDVTAYHLFYADAAGTPGTDITFFDWAFAQPKIEGSDQVSRTYFRVNHPEAISYWEKRLSEHDTATNSTTIANKQAILFTDPEGQRLGIINDQTAPFAGTVYDSVVPHGYALRGFYAVELSVVDARATADLLMEIMDWKITTEYIDPQTEQRVIVCSIDTGGPGKEIYIRELLAPPILASLAGSVHHIAFRVTNESELHDWLVRLEYLGIPNSGLVDRYYFKSLYFRISNGILFELATDGPGFATDENPEHIGERLSLPPFLESQREAIETGLLPLD